MLMLVRALRKISLALGAAGINQFLHLRNWRPEKAKEFEIAVKREVALELLLAMFIFMIAGFLTRTQLPGG